MDRRGDLADVGEGAEGSALVVAQKVSVLVGYGFDIKHLSHAVDIVIEGGGHVVGIGDDGVAGGDRLIAHILCAGEEGGDGLPVGGELRHQHVAVGPFVRRIGTEGRNVKGEGTAALTVGDPLPFCR